MPDRVLSHEALEVGDAGHGRAVDVEDVAADRSACGVDSLSLRVAARAVKGRRKEENPGSLAINEARRTMGS